MGFSEHPTSLLSQMASSYQIPSDHRLPYFTVTGLMEICETVGVHLPVGVKLRKAEIIDRLEERRRELHEAEVAVRRDAEAEKTRREAEALDLHRQNRYYEPRVQEGVEDLVGCLEYPLSYLDEYGGVGQVQRDLVGQEHVDLTGAGFPNTVAEYLWIHEGCNDDEPWKALCRLENGIFIFYKAECDYTGFDCQGNMQLWAARDLKTLLDLAMDIQDYVQWVAETSLAPQDI